MCWKQIDIIKGIITRKHHKPLPDVDEDVPPIPQTLFPELDSDDWKFINSLLKRYGRPLEDYIVSLRGMLVKTTCVEPIIRKDHWESFKKMFYKITETSVDGQPSIEITFHGTSESNISSIVRDGFLLPEYEGVKRRGPAVAHGSQWGLGIYSSQNISHSHNYGKETIIMCAVIMGRSYQFSTWPRKSLKSVVKGYESHISPDGDDWVVFHSDQIIPVCVLHIKPPGGARLWWKLTDISKRALKGLKNSKKYKYQKYRENLDSETTMTDTE
jgi:hypothetical protein